MCLNSIQKPRCKQHEITAFGTAPTINMMLFGEKAAQSNLIRKAFDEGAAVCAGELNGLNVVIAAVETPLRTCDFDFQITGARVLKIVFVFHRSESL